MRSCLATVLLGGCIEAAPITISDPTFDTVTETTGTEEDTTTPQEPPDGMCGDITEWDIFVQGAVIDDRDRPFEDADVQLVDRGWVPGTIMGSAITDADGRYQFQVNQLTSVEDCWGTLLDYVIVATWGDLVAEDGVNSQIYGSIVDGSLDVDLYTFPLVLE